MTIFGKQTLPRKDKTVLSYSCLAHTRQRRFLLFQILPLLQHSIFPCGPKKENALDFIFDYHYLSSIPSILNNTWRNGCNCCVTATAPNRLLMSKLGLDSIQGIEVNRLTINLGGINRLIDYNRLI